MDSFDFIQSDMLSYSAKHGYINIIKVLFKFGGSSFLNQPNNYNCTPIETLAKEQKEKPNLDQNYIDSILYLLKKGAKISISENTNNFEDLCGENKQLKALLLGNILFVFIINIFIIFKIIFYYFLNYFFIIF